MANHKAESGAPSALAGESICVAWAVRLDISGGILVGDQHHGGALLVFGDRFQAVNAIGKRKDLTLLRVAITEVPDVASR